MSQLYNKSTIKEIGNMEKQCVSGGHNESCYCMSLTGLTLAWSSEIKSVAQCEQWCCSPYSAVDLVIKYGYAETIDNAKMDSRMCTALALNKVIENIVGDITLKMRDWFKVDGFFGSM